ncbi:hypothetical protein ACQRIT_003038 [Beauveria bassiana]|uniref:Uncharacterized protein n=1 Tax=Beauveria bassiana D1-5 TaxID=1245745 RepID=A0A0A2VP50_BEABA|nr:hypothetical protein BBAD15_g5256 [Beauveria bassiana D1-5]
MADHIQEQKAVQESAPAQQQAPAQASAPVQRNGVVNDQDVKFWTDRANDFLARPSEHIHSRSPNGAQSWFAGFFDCFNPIDTCLITWCLPCVTFGQVQHRIQRSGELEGFEPLNTSHDKEAQHRERLLRQGSVDEQYKTTPGMSYPPQ